MGCIQGVSFFSRIIGDSDMGITHKYTHGNNIGITVYRDFQLCPEFVGVCYVFVKFPFWRWVVLPKPTINFDVVLGWWVGWLVEFPTVGCFLVGGFHQPI